jgi:hypothetical protein
MPALYSANNLFSLLQHALTQCQSRRIYIKALLSPTLNDWMTLATQAPTLPVPLHTVIPHPPTYIGTMDASALGMGGWWTTVHGDNEPTNFLWQAAFPMTIRICLVTPENPGGTITNSDLELAAVVLGSTLWQ